MIFFISKKIRILVFLFITASLLIPFQNCSNKAMKFAKVTDFASTGPNYCEQNVLDPACSAPPPVTTCQFNHRELADGDSVMSYQNSAVAYGQICQSQQRLCKAGVLSGNYNFEKCTVSAPQSCLFNGEQIASGAKVTAYLNSAASFGSLCQSEERTCENGVLSGSYSWGVCKLDAPASCLFNGKTILHGDVVSAYQILFS